MMFSPEPPPPRTEGLQMHAPVFLPNTGVDGRKIVIFGQLREPGAEPGAEEFLEDLVGNEIVVVFDGDDAALGVDARAGHDAVDVRVKMQALVAGMVGKLPGPARIAAMEVPAHRRSAAMGDGPNGAPLRLVERRIFRKKRRQEAAQRVDNGGGHAMGRDAPLTRQLAAERFQQGAAVLLAAVGEMHIDHGGLDILMA